MKEASWADCIDSCAAKKGTPDNAKANSLAATAHARLAFLNQPLTDANANFVFEGMYTSLLELLHAYLLRQGYRVDNHVCIGFYVRDVLRKHALFRAFDDFRYKRNGLVYYGKHLPFSVAEETIGRLREIIDVVDTL